MSILRVPTNMVSINYTNGSQLQEAAATNASVTISIVVPSGLPLYIDKLLASYVGGSASGTFTVTGIPQGMSAAQTFQVTVANTVSGPASSQELSMWMPLFGDNQTVTLVLAAGGASIIGFVSVLYRVE